MGWGEDLGGPGHRGLTLSCLCVFQLDAAPRDWEVLPGGGPQPQGGPEAPPARPPEPKGPAPSGDPPGPGQRLYPELFYGGAGAVGQVWGQGGCGVSLDSWRYLGGSYGCWGGPGWGAGGLGEQLRGMWGRVGGAWGGSGVLGRGVGCWGGARSRSGVLEVRVGGGGGAVHGPSVTCGAHL